MFSGSRPCFALRPTGISIGLCYLSGMAKQFPSFTRRLTDFVSEQPIFFVASAPAEGRVNCSPKGMDSLRILSPDRLVWLNVTGSGNETAAHVRENGRMTIMWCAFAGAPLILRAYGTARAVHPGDPDWEELYSGFKPIPGARQIFDMAVDMVQTSCGMAVPYLDFNAERTLLRDWADKKSEGEMQQYWEEKNLTSIDGLDTGMREVLK